MTSVLNAGIMTRNPVGNQIRSLQLQLDNERKVVQMLLTALESKSPDVFNEYTTLKARDDELMNQGQQQNQGQNQQFQQFQGQGQNQGQNQNQNQGQGQGQQRFQQGVPSRNPGGRF
jgi:hypothetical protein